MHNHGLMYRMNLSIAQKLDAEITRELPIVTAALTLSNRYSFSSATVFRLRVLSESSDHGFWDAELAISRTSFFVATDLAVNFFASAGLLES